MRIVLCLLLLAGCASQRPFPRAFEGITEQHIEDVHAAVHRYARERNLPRLDRPRPRVVFVAEPEALAAITNRPARDCKRSLLGASVPDHEAVYVVALEDAVEVMHTVAHELAHYYLGLDEDGAEAFAHWWLKQKGK